MEWWKSIRPFGPDPADEIIRRKRDREIVERYGAYRSHTILDTSDEVHAELIAQDYVRIRDERKDGWFHRRREDKLAKAVIAIAHRTVEGNITLYAIDVDSGLLEPGGTDTRIDRLILASDLARDILDGNFVRTVED